MVKKPVVFGVAGGTGSGKTTIAQNILNQLGADHVAYLAHDAYYRDISQMSQEERKRVNYDHPDSLETELMVKHVKDLIAGRAIELPIYDFATHLRSEETEHIPSSPLILVEGILVFTSPALRDLMDIKIFVDTDADVRLIRRLGRDIQDRGRSFDSVIKQYMDTVRPMHLEFVEPSKRYADVIIPEGGHNDVALSMVVSRLRDMLASDESI